MQEEVLVKRSDERLIEKDTDIQTTLISSNPFFNEFNVLIQKSIEKKLDYTNIQKSFEYSKNYRNEIKNRQIALTIKALRRNPDNKSLLHNLGMVYLNNGELKKAYSCFTAILKKDRNNRLANFSLASLYKKEKKHELALKIYNSLLLFNPDDTEAKINLANLYFIMQDLEKAKLLFTELFKSGESNIDVGNKLGVISLLQNKNNDAIGIFRKCIRLSPNNAAINNNLAVAYFKNKSYTKANKHFRIALNIFPEYYDALLNLASITYQIHGAKDALTVIEEFPTRKPNKNISDLLAFLYMKDNQVKRALTILKDLLLNAQRENLADDIARYLNNIAVAHQYAGNVEEAEKLYRLSIDKTEIQNEIVFINIIELYIELGKYVNARKYIDLMEEYFKKSNRPLFYRAIILYQTNRIDEALDSFEQLIKLEPSFIYAYIMLASIYAEFFDNYTKALELVKQASNLSPNNNAILNDYAYYLLMGNNIKEAELILHSIDQKIDNPFLHATRGLFEIKQGNLDLGRRMYNEASKLATDVYLRERILQKKELEIAKYFISINKISNAKEILKKLIKNPFVKSIFIEQANKLLAKLVEE